MPAAEFAYNSAVSEDLAMSPFELDLGWCSKSPPDILTDKNHENESAQEFKQTMKEILNDPMSAQEI